MSWKATSLFPGRTSGEVLRFDAPISFWGGVDPQNASVSLAGHPQQGQSIAGKILVIPSLVGSSSSSAVILELLYKGIAPIALILGESDAILPVGVLVAQQMDWPTIPVLMLKQPPFLSGQHLSISTSGQIDVL